VTPAGPPAVLLGGEAIALSVARSLTSAGVEVHALGHGRDPLRFSRCRRSFTSFDGARDLQQAWLDELRRAPRQAVVLPCSDDGLELVASNRKALLDLGYLCIEADDRAILAMLDKRETYQLADRAGVPAPRTATVSSQEDAARAVERISPPWALKPVHSHRFARHFGLRKKVFVVEDEQELREALDKTLELGIAMVLTEIIPGADDAFESYYTYLDENGTPLFEFTKRKLRQYPTGFGLGTYHKTDWNPEVAELGLSFLRAAGVRGLANVEFKRDSRDRRLKLIECNYRFTAATELIRASGLELALFVYERALGRWGPDLSRYRTDVHLLYPVEDLRAFLDLRRDGELTFLEWARGLARRQHFPVASPRDPLPTLVQHGRMVGRGWRRAAAAGARLRPRRGLERGTGAS
jgi:D-aspartate ligase